MVFKEGGLKDNMKFYEGKSMTGVAGMIGVFVFIILALTFSDAIGDAIWPAVNANGVTNESFSVSTAVVANPQLSLNPATALALAHNNWSVSQIRAFNGTIYVSGTDYILNETLSRVYFRNTTTTVYNVNLSNTTYVDYSWEAAEYINDSLSRTIINNLVLLMFIVGFVIYLAAMVYNSYWKDSF